MADGAIQEVTVFSLAVAQVLIDKGLITEKELENAQVRVRAALDQQRAKFIEENPNSAAAMESKLNDMLTELFGDKL